MADNVPNFIAITVPHGLTFNGEVREALNNLTKEVGGNTRTEGFGEWFDLDGKLHAERVLIFKWNFKDQQLTVADALSRKVVDALFTAGEQAVFKERYYSVDAILMHRDSAALDYRANIIHRPRN